MPMPEEYITSKIAEFAWRAVGDISLNCMLAVMFVVRNRVRAGWNHGSWLEVVADMLPYTPGQRTTAAGPLPDPRNPVFSDVLRIVDEIFDGRREDNLTGGAMHYARPDNANWLQQRYMSDPIRYPRTGDISGVLFFGEVDDSVSAEKF